MLAASHLVQLDYHAGVGLPTSSGQVARPDVPRGEGGTRGRQAVPLHLAQLDHQIDVGAGLVPPSPVGMARPEDTHEGCPYVPARPRGAPLRFLVRLQCMRSGFPYDEGPFHCEESDLSRILYT